MRGFMQPEKSLPKNTFTGALLIPIVLAVAQLLLHIAFHGNYGYFRDELYYIACSNHLAWGYVDQPPLSIVILRLSRFLTCDSLHAIRFLPALACAVVVVLGALMARRMGGGRFAQGLAAFAVFGAPVVLGQGSIFTMNAFDMLFWSLAIYLAISVLLTGNQRLWMHFGVVVGFGLLNKYSIGFLCIGLVAGLLLTRYRNHLASRWFWFGVLLAALIFLPHVIWEVTHGLPSIEFMRNASLEKNIPLTPLDLLLGQLRDMNIVSGVLLVLGILFFFTQDGGRYRPLGWMYVVVFIVMVAAHAKVYYISPVDAVMVAGGAVYAERTWRGPRWKWIRPSFIGLLTLGALVSAPFAIPVLPVDRFIQYEHFLGMSPPADERISLGELPQYYADQFGWEEMVATVAKAYRSLTPEEQAQCVIYARNYGEAGAIDFFGRQYGLPSALCAHNSYWWWGPGDRSGNIAVIIGTSRDMQASLDDLRQVYRQVEYVGSTGARYCMPFENGRPIFVCRGMNTTFQAIWPKERFYI